MTKKFIFAMAIVAAMFASYSAYNAQNERELTGFALANIEALANGEKPEGFLIVDKNSIEVWDEETETHKMVVTIICDGAGSKKCE